MITLYRPVKIESAEQAEALPIGTYAVLWNTCRIAVKVRAVQWDAESGSYGNRDMLMAEALVPIEAKEETMRYPCADSGDPFARLTTPWTPMEDA